MILCHIRLNPIIADDSNPSKLKVSGKEGISRCILRGIDVPAESGYRKLIHYRYSLDRPLRGLGQHRVLCLGPSLQLTNKARFTTVAHGNGDVP
jgi:hypothetical protein